MQTGLGGRSGGQSADDGQPIKPLPPHEKERERREGRGGGHLFFLTNKHTVTHTHTLTHTHTHTLTHTHTHKTLPDFNLPTKTSNRSLRERGREEEEEEERGGLKLTLPARGGQFV